MRFLIVGLGSMGKRRIRNLQSLKVAEVLGFDPRPDRGGEAAERYGVRTFTKFDDALKTNPDALIISTPPDLHLEYARIALQGGKHCFMEASVLSDGLDEVIALSAKQKRVAAPSCTMRFHPSVRVIKELVEHDTVGTPLSFTYHSGQYLPDWHPWEDYRSYYVAKRATGACREIVPFELVWLTWVLGDVETVSCFRGKLSTLDADIDDTYQLLLRFKRGILGHMLVDVVSRVPYRTYRLLGEQGVIDWVWSEKKVRVFTADSRTWTEYPEPAGIVERGYLAAEDMYIEEMKQFVEAVEGVRDYPYTLAEDKRVLDLLRAAEQSSVEGKHLQLG